MEGENLRDVIESDFKTIEEMLRSIEKRTYTGNHAQDNLQKLYVDVVSALGEYKTALLYDLMLRQIKEHDSNL